MKIKASWTRWKFESNNLIAIKVKFNEVACGELTPLKSSRIYQDFIWFIWDAGGEMILDRFISTELVCNVASGGHIDPCG
mgnify:CR=1 FL=1|tara:strand:+ start:1312 stop:1551 length:240 start_codon:yes stop_codon:yes gene_type:complete